MRVYYRFELSAVRDTCCILVYLHKFQAVLSTLVRNKSWAPTRHDSAGIYLSKIPFCLYRVNAINLARFLFVGSAEWGVMQVEMAPT